jgi:signal peptidase
MSKKTPSTETLLKRSAPQGQRPLLKDEGRSSSEAFLKASGCSSTETLLKRSAPQGRRPLLEAEDRSSNMFFEVTVNLLRSGQSVRFQAPGKSMKPTIREDETITVDPITPLAVRKGDIILYKNGTGVIAHRVVRIEKQNPSRPQDTFILRGDASILDDKPVAPGQVLGKVISVERGGRTIDLYSRRVKTMRTARLLASRLKRLIKPLIFTNHH